MKKIILFLSLFFILIVVGCHTATTPAIAKQYEGALPDQFLVVTGIAQDAGYPQIGCTKECCASFWKGNEGKKHITSLAVIDRGLKKYWLFEATPDITAQLHFVQSYLPDSTSILPDCVFITHAHIGHYTGLMELGKEAIGATNVPVYVMPRLDSFLRQNGPWSQLVQLNNIQLKQLRPDSTVTITPRLKVTPFVVPHRDEYSETVGNVIEGSNRKILFIPDIDKWENWNRDIAQEIMKVDIALLDGTFLKNGELPGRDMSLVPHPFVEETVSKFSSLPDTVKSKIVFIHFNHTNPLLKNKAKEKDDLKAAGFGVAEEGMIIGL